MVNLSTESIVKFNLMNSYEEYDEEDRSYMSSNVLKDTLNIELDYHKSAVASIMTV